MNAAWSVVMTRAPTHRCHPLGLGHMTLDVGGIGCSSVSGRHSDRQFKGMAIRVMELSKTGQLCYHILYCRVGRVLQIVIGGAD